VQPTFESLIKNEVNLLIARLQNYKNAPFDPFDKIVRCSANIIHRLLFGRPVENERLMHYFRSGIMRPSGWGSGLVSHFTISKIGAAFGRAIPSCRKWFEENLEILSLISDEFEKTKSVFDPNRESLNFVHMYMKEATDAINPYFREENLRRSVMELLITATEQVYGIVHWAILFLVTHPDVQERLHEEIKTQPGDDLNYANREKLPFVEAVIMETLRRSNMNPVSAMRRTMAPTKLLGCDIPEDTAVVMLMTNVLHNPEYYPDPFRFDPTRFLDSDGHIRKDPRLIPHSIGKRSCAGESMSKMEIFLFTVGIFSRLSIYLPPDKPPPTLKRRSAAPIPGTTNFPWRFEVCVDERSCT